jgi:hypothetical protein
MTHQHLTPEDASLYALGSLERRETDAFDREAATCDECAQLLAQASDALARIVLEDAAPAFTPPRLVTGRKRPRIATTVSFAAVAAAIAIAFLSAWRLAVVDLQLRANDLALSAIVGSHFSHAQFVSKTAGAPPAKLLYARDHSWLYIVVQRPTQRLTAESFENATATAAVLGSVPPAHGPSAIFIRPATRVTAVVLVDSRGTVIERASLP